MPSKKSSGSKAGKKKSTGSSSRKPRRSYALYIHRVLKESKEAKGMRLSKKAMAIMNSFVVDLFERLAGEAGRLAQHAGTKTLRAKTFQAAVRLHLPGELAQHAQTDAMKAVGRYAGGK
eukprot:TRINITY_DN30778_c0_g1_i4.p1 TRINITY_DN30778_c0_g1~~TRINITY_DN30778_c0_g1_i4.p1  ORF type:complete len:119 (+),score=39.60 TRINITY_DN30778_c0_g1_i4:73-429(+)